MSHPAQTNNRNFKRGEVYMVTFDGEDDENLPEPSRALKGEHRAVVLFDSTFPRKTVVVVPITSLYDKDNNIRSTISTDVTLLAEEYKNAGNNYKRTIHVDSFLKTEQIHSVSRVKLEGFKGNLLPKDMAKLDVQLIATLGLQNTINTFIEAEVQERLQERLEALGIDPAKLDSEQ